MAVTVRVSNVQSSVVVTLLSRRTPRVRSDQSGFELSKLLSTKSGFSRGTRTEQVGRSWTKVPRGS